MNEHERWDRGAPDEGRRRFLRSMGAGLGSLGLGSIAAPGFGMEAEPGLGGRLGAARGEYGGPNVIIVRFGGGARRRETIEPEHTWSPYLCHELIKRGTLFPNMFITSVPNGDVSHGQGTLNILTGHYDNYRDVGDKFLGERFEAGVPTVFEYLRKSFDVPEHQTLIVNGEDRIDEEFYTFSNHHMFGVRYRCEVLSLFRYKSYLLTRQLEEGKWRGEERKKQEGELAKMESLDDRVGRREGQAKPIHEFWERWREYYGESGLVNPRGDRVLTELALRAMKELRPKLMMINYQDCDYVHWGNLHHYHRGVQIMDEGLRQLVQAAAVDEHYRDNTIFVVVPDCGRDSSPLRAVPCQHHFNSKSAREIFALVFGPGVASGAIVDRQTEQADVASTVGGLMGFKAEHAEGSAMEEAFA